MVDILVKRLNAVKWKLYAEGVQWRGLSNTAYTDKKENQIFLIYREIQNGAVAKSYMYD